MPRWQKQLEALEEVQMAAAIITSSTARIPYSVLREAVEDAKEVGCSMAKIEFYREMGFAESRVSTANAQSMIFGKDGWYA
jgi:hypothetical protein